MERNKIILIFFLGLFSFSRATTSGFSSTWGRIDGNSVLIGTQRFGITVTLGATVSMNVTANADRLIDGMGMSISGTQGSYQLINGGVGLNFATFRISATGTSVISQTITFTLQFFSDSAQETTESPIPPSTTSNPNDPIIWGDINDQSRTILDERNYYYPSPWGRSNMTIERSFRNTIHGMRLTRLNNTIGEYRLNSGGVNENFVNFFFGSRTNGDPYDFRLEVFTNNASMKSFSGLLVSFGMAIFYVIHFRS